MMHFEACASKVRFPPFHFTGKERDSESGLDIFGARYYGSALGRFTSSDPLRSSGNPKNPQSWNRYAYVLNNPLALIDPNGQCSAPAVGKGQVGVCVDLYIAAPRIGGIGYGDARGPAPNDKSATYRTEVQLALDPQNSTASIVKNDAGISRAKLIGIPDSPAELDLSRKGTSTSNISPVKTDDDGAGGRDEDAAGAGASGGGAGGGKSRRAGAGGDI